MGAFRDLTGCKFGLLSVIKFIEKRNGRMRWLCKCDCGATRDVASSGLVTGSSRSCGSRKHSIGRTSHGFSGTPTYNSWSHLRSRCKNKNNKKFKSYGARGISVCKRWDRFENFLEDMGPKPPGKTIDRIDNNGDYTANNCRWATPSEQAQNQRTTQLKDFEVSMIRHLFSRGINRKQLAKIFHANYGNIKAIIQGRTWRNV